MYDNVVERVSEGNKVVNCGDREVDGILLVKELDELPDGYCYQVYDASSMKEAEAVINKIKGVEDVSELLDVRHVVLSNDRDCVKRIVNANLLFTSVVTQFTESKK